jgi:tRNA U34 5-carboxymethylaminomethyl modifying GTPase MnmE/TrmE
LLDAASRSIFPRHLFTGEDVLELHGQRTRRDGSARAASARARARVARPGDSASVRFSTIRSTPQAEAIADLIDSG